MLNFMDFQLYIYIFFKDVGSLYFIITNSLIYLILMVIIIFLFFYIFIPAKRLLVNKNSYMFVIVTGPFEDWLDYIINDFYKYLFFLGIISLLVLLASNIDGYEETIKYNVPEEGICLVGGAGGWPPGGDKKPKKNDDGTDRKETLKERVDEMMEDVKMNHPALSKKNMIHSGFEEDFVDKFYEAMHKVLMENAEIRQALADELNGVSPTWRNLTTEIRNVMFGRLHRLTLYELKSGTYGLTADQMDLVNKLYPEAVDALFDVYNKSFQRFGDPTEYSNWLISYLAVCMMHGVIVYIGECGDWETLVKTTQELLKDPLAVPKEDLKGIIEFIKHWINSGNNK